MPSTLTGLLVFVVLLLPGFAYLVGKERAGTERRESPFRETVSIVSASVSAELAVLIVTFPFWRRHIDLEALIHTPGEYARSHYTSLALWSLGWLLGATAIAYIVSRPPIRGWPMRLGTSKNGWVSWIGKLTPGGYPHDSAVSGWWILFEKWRQGREINVGCVLDDGSYVHGALGSFSRDADDTTDRDLLLTWPITYRQPGSQDTVDYPAGAVCIPAGRIVTMFVTYSSAAGSPSPNSSSEAGAAEAEQVP